jgi:hypothetical protein
MSSYPYEEEEEVDEEEEAVLKDFQTVEDNLMILIDARPAMLVKNAEGKVRVERGGVANEGGGGMGGPQTAGEEVGWERHHSLPTG